jgi:tetratricopeptide (TPR) repeat protein
VLWEAGAVDGADRAAGDGTAQRVWPISFGLRSADVPSPFGGKQVIDGTSASDVDVLVDALFQRLGAGFTPTDIKRFGARQRGAVDRYVGTISGLLLKLPLRVTEDAVQEWLLRLDDLNRKDRYSEVAVVENWLDVAFGREEQDRARPIDIRLHRKMGDLYAFAGRPAEAARQFELARKLAPRDIYLLRRLGKALLDLNDLAAAGRVLAEIADLDAKAFERNVENAALKARWCEASGDLRGAGEVVDTAYRANPGSYYLGDRLAQILLRQSRLDEARTVYRQVLASVDELSERNIWTSATGLTAAIALADATHRDRYLDELQQLKPSKEERASIRRGIGAVLAAIGGDSSILNVLERS